MREQYCYNFDFIYTRKDWRFPLYILFLYATNATLENENLWLRSLVSNTTPDVVVHYSFTYVTHILDGEMSFD